MRGYESQSNIAFHDVPVGGLGVRSDVRARHNFARRFGAANPEQPVRNHKPADFYAWRDPAARHQRPGHRGTESNDPEPEPEQRSSWATAWRDFSYAEQRGLSREWQYLEWLSLRLAHYRYLHPRRPFRKYLQTFRQSHESSHPDRQ